MGLAILVTAREHDAQYEWTVNEFAAVKDGLEQTVVDVVRHRQASSGLSENDAAVVELGRELFGKHNVTPQTYARALKAFGERDLVDLVGLMAQCSSDAALTLAFDQHLPAGRKPLLPIPGERFADSLDSHREAIGMFDGGLLFPTPPNPVIACDRTVALGAVSAARRRPR